MEPDWNYVKKHTLWSYEDLIRKLLKVLAYNFVREHYSHTMKEAIDYAGNVQQGYLQSRKHATLRDDMIKSFDRLRTLQIGTYLHLIQQIDTREKCEAFLRRTGFGFEEIIQMLNYLFRWVLPFAIPARELIVVDIDPRSSRLTILKHQGLRLNLDVLEQGRQRIGRARLSKATGLPNSFILSLVHRADISRLAYVRGKTVRHLCGGGYDTLQKLAEAEHAQMEKTMDAYFRTLGKSMADYKLVVPLSWMIGGARILPKIVEE